MTTREQKIEAIYEKIANKELSFGCKYIGKFYCEGIVIFSKLGNTEIQDIISVKSNRISGDFLKDIIIIGHPVMIGDVLDYIRTQYEGKPGTIGAYSCRVVDKWEHKRKPIEEQSDECVSYIYNLLGND